jgi:serine/tyrosine/threonine adenylyltransferase
MMRAEVDMTLFFTHLPHINLVKSNIADLKSVFYTEQGYLNFEEDFNDWLAQYAKRILQSNESDENRHARMASFNPRYVLRNYLAQEAIDLAEQGDTCMIETLLKLLQNPYTKQAGMEKFEEKRPDWARHKAGCSMLSCSS